MSLRVRTEVKEVLLAMTIKPFLSHTRENASAVGALRDSLKIYGAGGWKDTEDLPVGDRTPEAVRRAILEETGGFIWWGTRSALDSNFINTVEIPAAFDRNETDSLYAIVPIFVDLDPGKETDRDAIRAALGERGDALLDCNGLIRRGSESPQDFRRRAARRYIRDAVKRLMSDCDKQPIVAVSARALSEPSGEYDLTLDWRPLINAEQRSLKAGSNETVVDALRWMREAFQAGCPSPEVLVDLDLPLPLAFQLGYEWRLPTRLKLVIRQRTGVAWTDIESDGDLTPAPEPTYQTLSGKGPVVLAVSCLDGLGQTAAHYADRIEGSELVTVHVQGILSPVQLRGLARRTAGILRDLNNRGVSKHLLLLGPAALAVFIGVASNAVGRVEVPFWNGQTYVSGVIVGH